MNDVMVDLETLGTLPGSIILSIGAVAFDEMEVAEKGFYRSVKRITCENFGLTADPKTEAWWEEQSEEARKVLIDPTGVSIYNALYDFNEWLSQYGENVRVWGNGANFDNPLLAVAHAKTMVKPRYKFWNERCYRTVKNQFPDIKLERTGTYHNAMDDARSQAQHLVEICQKRDWRLR
jgi:DNA polymerase III epsilon subunit-like protein